MTKKTQQECIEIAHNAILDKGYSIFDFDISHRDKNKATKVTRKSQHITCNYKNQSLKEWAESFKKDLEEHTFG